MNLIPDIFYYLKLWRNININNVYLIVFTNMHTVCFLLRFLFSVFAKWLFIFFLFSISFVFLFPLFSLLPSLKEITLTITHNIFSFFLFSGIPIVYILATVPAILPWENEYRFLSWCHLVGSVAPWCGSFVYHLFMNLEHGEYTYYRLLQLDMLGIWISQSFGMYNIYHY